MLCVIFFVHKLLSSQLNVLDLIVVVIPMVLYPSGLAKTSLRPLGSVDTVQTDGQTDYWSKIEGQSGDQSKSVCT